MRKNFRPQDIVVKVGFTHAAIAAGATTKEAAKKQGISPATYYRWRGRYLGMTAEQLEKVRELQLQNARLRKALLELA